MRRWNLVLGSIFLVSASAAGVLAPPARAADSVRAEPVESAALRGEQRWSGGERRRPDRAAEAAWRAWLVRELRRSYQKSAAARDRYTAEGRRSWRGYSWSYPNWSSRERYDSDRTLRTWRRQDSEQRRWAVPRPYDPRTGERLALVPGVGVAEPEPRVMLPGRR
jgi:hypothetical protein